MTASIDNKWFFRVKPASSARFRLICFAYAGGAATVFNDWHLHLPDWIDVVAIVMPGSQQRRDETMPVRMGMLVSQLANGIKSELDLPYALVGSCTGSLIAFELSHSLKKRGFRTPDHLFVTNCRGPHLPDRDAPIHKYDDDQLRKELVRLGGTAPEILNHPDIMRILGPILRADFELAETYIYRSLPPLAHPITSFCGAHDKVVTQDECATWSQHTTANFELKTLEGGHYLIEDATTELCQIIGSICKTIIE
jgi:medium-chain acyl-[acyl-carrier-protein] hydrolase